MKKNLFTINYANGTIDGSAHAFKKAGVYGSFEYKELHKMMKDNPTLIPNVIMHPCKEGKKTYSGLNFDKMREYISTVNVSIGFKTSQDKAFGTTNVEPIICFLLNFHFFFCLFFLVICGYMFHHFA